MSCSLESKNGNVVMSVKEIYARNGRINYKKLKEFVQTVNKTTFCSMLNHPLLVSKKLYEGELSNVGNSTNTMVFNVKAVREHIAKSSSESALYRIDMDDNVQTSIFALVKGRDSYTDVNTFTVGRMIPNDIVIPDFTISKHHATIKIIDGEYHCFDLNSTNYTFVGDDAVEANKSKILRSCEYITFGRLGFIFMPAEKLYDMIALQ